jgi:L-arabinose isomerase
MTTADRDNTGIKIGYMPLAHDSYWKFFPKHLPAALHWANVFKDFLAQFGTICETGQLVDCPARSVEARRHFQAMDVDVFILATVTYSTPDDIVLDLKRFPRPTIIWNTQASPTLPPDTDFDKWMMEHGVTGVPGLANVMRREEIPYFMISGHYTNERVQKSFAKVLAGVRAAKALWGSRIGIFGHLYPGMIDFGYDPADLYCTFGVDTVNILDSKVAGAFKEVDPKEVTELEAGLCKKYSMADQFEGEEFARSARLALAMKRIAEEFKLDAATVYCQSMWQHPEVGVVSCIGNSMLAEQGIFCSCEGDVPTAVCGLIFNSLTAGKAVFTEIWTNDFDTDCFMMGHSGQMNLALFREDSKAVRLSRHPWWQGCHGRGACLQLQMPPGPVTLLGLCSTTEGGWRLVVTTGQVTERPTVPLGAPNFFLKLNRPIHEWIEDFGTTGAGHHLSMAYGDWTEELKVLAKLLQVDYRFV